MNNNIKVSIANAALKLKLRAECTPDSVSRGLLLEVANLYNDTYGYVPESWLSCMQECLRIESISTKYVLALIEEGYSPDELALLAMPDLRDLYEEVCVRTAVTTITTVTSSGGVSVKRVA
jgi:hypothetical protein